MFRIIIFFIIYENFNKYCRNKVKIVFLDFYKFSNTKFFGKILYLYSILKNNKNQ